jgi:hypothetical protein
VKAIVEKQKEKTMNQKKEGKTDLTKEKERAWSTLR